MRPAPVLGDRDLFDGEDSDVRQDAAKIVQNPEQWLNAPNDQLGGLAPNDLIDRGEAGHVRDLIRAIQHGMFT